MNPTALIEKKFIPNGLGQAAVDSKFTMDDALLSTTGSLESINYSVFCHFHSLVILLSSEFFSHVHSCLVLFRTDGPLSVPK